MLYQMINEEMDAAKVIAGSLRPGMIDTPMQARLRAHNKAQLPSQQFFADAHQNEILRSAEEVAAYMADVLLNTDDESFKQQEWNINA